MKIVYRPEYNIDLGLLNRLHPFDGRKYAKVFEAIAASGTENVVLPERPVDDAVINAFVNELMKRVLKAKRYILQALEVPYIPLLPFSWIDKRVLLPMRWAVAGTIKGAELALAGTNCRNLSGGYHHASRKSAQGSCIYNDIGIAYDQMMAAGRLSANDRVLIIDIDVCHRSGWRLIDCINTAA